MTDHEKNDPVGPGHYFELLDRTHVASLYLQTALGEHPVLARHPHLHQLYEAAVAQLEDLYQAIGQYDLE